jgi:alkylhydroperoxidase family enzyme
MNALGKTAVRIDITPPSTDKSKVDAIMAPYKEMLGRAPGGLQLLGASPPLLEHYAGTIGYYMGHPNLGQPLLTFIRYLVSWRGDCAYCIDLSEAFLISAGLDLDTIRATREDPTRAPLEEREKAMLLLALDAVDRPESVSTERLDGLRDFGWSDRDILDAVWHATSNRAFGRTVESFGLPPDGYIA